MAFRDKLADQLKDRSESLKRQKALLARVGSREKSPTNPVAQPTQAAPVKAEPIQTAPSPKIAKVRMVGEPVLKITVDGGKDRQFLTPALRECVDLYLQAAQTGSRECVLLWPGTLECLPLVHALSTIERWAQGYKRGLRSVLYPATTATFFPLNHIYANRVDISCFNSMWQELTEPKQAVPEESCEDKDLMLFALAAQFKDEDIQPCLNELIPHFFLETGDAKGIESLNYGSTYLSHVITKLAKRGQKQYLKESTFQSLGAAKSAPDAMFALSYKMTKQEMTAALTALKGMSGIHVALLDATRIAFDRVERVQNRIAAFLRCMTDVFGDDGPGVLIITNDPRQMGYVRAAIQREEQARHQRYRFRPTHAFRMPEIGRGFQPDDKTDLIVLDDAVISVEVTDKETAKLANKAFRLAQQKHLTPEVVEALNRVSKFVQTMGNLPSASCMLYKWLEDSMADEAQRRRYDWVALQNGLMRAVETVPPDLRRLFTDWLAQASALLARQEEGTPLAHAMVSLVKKYAKAGEKILVVVQSNFYQKLAKEYFLNEADTEEIVERVDFVSLAMRKKKVELFAPDRLIVCAMAPDLLGWVVTTPTLPCAIDFLLTQHTATATHYALVPVLKFDAFKPYEKRVRAIHDRILVAQTGGGAVLPEFDYQIPTFTLTTPGVSGAVPGAERGPTDYVEIAVEGGHRIVRGLHSRIYLYDPAAADSRSLGFRAERADAIKPGDHIFEMTEEMRERAEAAFDAAGVIFDHAGEYETLLRQYHRQVLQHVTAKFGGSVSVATRAIREEMLRTNCAQEAGNIRYWINLKNAEKTPFDELMPQAPRHFDTFRVFMEVLGFDPTMTQVFWDGAVKRVRGSRISDGINMGDHYARALFDPDAAAVYDRLPQEVLRSLRSGALDNVYMVTAISFGTTTPRGP